MFKKNGQAAFGGQQGDPQGLKLKWNQFDIFTVENLYTFECSNFEQVMTLFHFGIKNKVIGSHKMNLTSSRSHSIFTITLEQIEAQNPDNVIISKLQLVDLAGSERQSYTSVSGKTQKESIEINKSLFTLRQVITALNDLSNGKKEGVYVPYRDSKLTCLLRQSIGGNAYCCMIACLHPSERFIDENVSTLTYASKASLISNQPIKNDDPKTKQIEELKTHVQLLTNELIKANSHIQFLSQICGQKAEVFGANLLNNNLSQNLANQNITIHNNYNSNVVAYIGNKSLQQKGQTNSIQNSQTGQQLSGLPQIKNKIDINQTIQDIDESPIILDGSKIKKKQQQNIKNGTGQSIQSNLQQQITYAQDVFRDTTQLQQQLQQASVQNQQMRQQVFQTQLENDDLRFRLQYLETLCGRDSSFIRDNITEESSKIDWARLLLDENTEDMIINVSREKIAHEIIMLRQENTRLLKSVDSKRTENSNSCIKIPSFDNNIFISERHKQTGKSQKKQQQKSLINNSTQFGLLGHKKSSITPMRSRALPPTGKLTPMQNYNDNKYGIQQQQNNMLSSDRNLINNQFNTSQNSNITGFNPSFYNSNIMNQSNIALNQQYQNIPYQTYDNQQQISVKANNNQEFQSTNTSEFFKQKQFVSDQKISLPYPHVTMRKKSTQMNGLERANSTLRRSISNKEQNKDPMSQTLQKWRDQIKDKDNIVEDQSEYDT